MIMLIIIHVELRSGFESGLVSFRFVSQPTASQKLIGVEIL